MLIWILESVICVGIMKSEMQYRFLVLMVICFCLSMNLCGQSQERHWKANVYKLKVMSYNIMNGFDYGKDTERKQRFVEWVKKAKPDVLALQELCGFDKNKLKEMAGQWGHTYVEILKENGYPVGITSKYPITVKNKFLEMRGHGLLHVKVLDFDILVTHLNPSSWEKRLEDASTIVDYIRTIENEQVLLMGDMNAHSPMDADNMVRYSSDLLFKLRDTDNLVEGKYFDYSVISRLLSLPLYDLAFPFLIPENDRATFPTPILMTVSKNYLKRRGIGERLDYIMGTVRMVEKVCDAYIIKNEDTDFLSDHYPVCIELLCEKNMNNN